MVRFKRFVTIAMLGITTTVFLAGCTSSRYTQVAWEDDGRPRHMHHSQDSWQYRFVYYPNEQVYYEPYSATYYWYEGRRWHEGSELPQYITPDPDEFQIVHLKAYRPHAQHDRVAGRSSRAYPPTPFEEDEQPPLSVYAAVDTDHE